MGRPQGRNQYTFVQGAVEILLTQGQKALIDLCDFRKVFKYHWHARSTHSGWYAYTNASGHSLSLHCLIMGVSSRETPIDHKDGNGLNNRRSNLRLSTHSQNQFNTLKRGCGVFFDTTAGSMGMWRAKIRSEGKAISKCFFSRLDALECRLIMEQIVYGSFNRTNV